jgi:hypothetical protein
MWRVEALPITAARGQGGANKLQYDKRNKRVFFADFSMQSEDV